MTQEEIRLCVRREMAAYIGGWQLYGEPVEVNTLKQQLGALMDWSESEPTTEYTAGTEFMVQYQ